MTESAKLEVSVSSKGVKTATEELKKLGGQSGSTEDKVKNLGSSLAGLASALAGGLFLKTVIDNTIAQEAAVAQLEATIVSTGGAAGVTTAEMVALAGSLQNVTTFGDEVIISAQSQLLTFTKLGKDVIPDATEALLDLATKMGGDLKGATVQLGKALNDPVEGISALTRVGVTFTDEQKSVIKALVQTGDVAGAQKIILAELSVEFGGSARAARDTLGGALKSLQNSFGDLLEGSGGNLNDAKSAVEDLNSAISDPSVKAAFASITSAILLLATTAANALPALTGFTTWVGETLAAAIYGPAADDLVRTSDAIIKLKTELDKFDKIGGLAKALSADTVKEMRQELAGLEAQYAMGIEGQANASAAQQKEAQAKTEALAAQVKAKQDDLKRAQEEGASAAIQIAAQKEIDKARKKSDASAAQDAKRSEQLTKTLNEQVAVLQEQALNVGKSTKEVTLLKLAQDGANKSQLEAAKIALESIDAQKLKIESDKLATKQAGSTAAYAAALDAQVAARQNAATVEVQAIGLGQQQAELLKELSELEFEYAKRIQELAVAQGTSTALTKVEYDKRLDLLKDAKDKEVAIVIAAEEAKRKAMLSATAGAKTAVEDYLADAADVAGQTKKIVGNALQGLEDQLVAVTQGGKLNFKSLVDSILADLARAGVKQLLAGGLTALTGLGSAAMGAGGGAGLSGLFSSFAGLFDNGGNIPNGKFGIVGEKGPEIVRGPVNVTGRTDTAKMSGGNTIIINQPGVTSTREADRSAGATRRAVTSAVNSGSRYA
jgi:lambda family phage tail tape measure protein